MAQGRAKGGPGQRSASAGPGKTQAFEWTDRAVQRKAGIAAGGGKFGFARGKRSEPGGSPGTREHDSADAAAGNGNAFGAADCGPRGGSRSHAEFGCRDRHDGNFHAFAVTEFPGCAGIAGGRGAASDVSTVGNRAGTLGAADQYYAGKRRAIFTGSARLDGGAFWSTSHVWISGQRDYGIH